jgi:hydroxymethylbilane synthase
VSAIRIGTRGSALALWQANTVAGRLRERGAAVEILTISTRGDRRQTESLAEISAEVGKGVFTKEIQEALIRGDIDVAVHSSKDMAAVPPDGLSIAAVLEREDPRDALVLPGAPAETPFSPDLLGASPRIGTGSPRRVAQLRRLFGSAHFEGIRGNVDTRLRKLDAGEADAIVLACAGLRRLGFADRITSPIPVETCIPAPGQGIVAIETRTEDRATVGFAGLLNDETARICLAAEQAVVASLGGGCQLPLGVFAERDHGSLRLRAIAASVSGDDVVTGELTGEAAAAVDLGRRLADLLRDRGAERLLRT